MSTQVFTQKQAVAAYRALVGIQGQKMNWQLTYQIARLMERLEKQYAFQTDCERKLVEKYNGQVNSNGNVTLETAEKARAFDAEWNEIGEIRLTDLHIEPVVIPETANLEVSVADLRALRGFVEFRLPEPKAEPEPAWEMLPEEAAAAETATEAQDAPERVACADAEESAATEEDARPAIRLVGGKGMAM